MRFVVVLLFGLAASAAIAQVQTPLEQALSDKLINEINENVQLRIRLMASEARIDELKRQKAKEDKPTK